MLVQAGRVAEFPSAVQAGVRFLSRVDPVMPYQIRLVPKAFDADKAPVFLLPPTADGFPGRFAFLVCAGSSFGILIHRWLLSQAAGKGVNSVLGECLVRPGPRRGCPIPVAIFLVPVPFLVPCSKKRSLNMQPMKEELINPLKPLGPFRQAHKAAKNLG